MGIRISKYLSDYEMQLWLDKKGIKLYNPQIDNNVDNEELCKHAMNFGWISEWKNGQWMWHKELLKQGECR